MTNTNTAKVTFNLTSAKDESELKWTFNDAAQTRFGKGTGLRHNIGAMYFLANKEDREIVVNFFGKGAVRRGLLVLAKGRNTDEKDSAKAVALAGSLRSVSATVAA